MVIVRKEYDGHYQKDARTVPIVDDDDEDNESSNERIEMCYPQISPKMVEIMRNQASSCDLKELVAKFIPESIGREIEKATQSIFPPQNIFIHKVKIVKAPKFHIGKLTDVHGDYSEDVGVKLERLAEETSRGNNGRRRHRSCWRRQRSCWSIRIILNMCTVLLLG
ncbi:hypothetical protein AgCh_022929 [Apium graveolens]